MMATLTASCPQQAEDPIVIAAHTWGGYELMFMAQELGWLPTRQVEFLRTASATESLQALRDGRIDGAGLTLDEVLRARRDGLKLTIILVFDISAGADALVAIPAIQQLSDLRGRRLGYEAGAVGEWMLVNALRKSGLKAEEVRLLPIAMDRHDETFERDVDALVTYEPVVSRLMERGARRLFDSREIPNTIVDVLALRSDRIPQLRQASIRHLVDAIFRARRHLAVNPADAAYRLAPRFELSADRVLTSFRGLVLPDASYNRRLLAGDEPVLKERAALLAASLGHTPDDDFDRLFAADYLPATD